MTNLENAATSENVVVENNVNETPENNVNSVFVTNSGDTTEFVATGSHWVDLTGMPEKFSGHFFKRWQQRMKIWLITKGLLSVIMTVCPPVVESDPKSLERQTLWRERNEIAKGMILLGLSDMLFDVYCTLHGTAKDLWDELDRKYNTDDHDLEKYIVSKFLRSDMKEGKSVLEQTQEFELILHSLREADMELPEKFKVMAVIEKFPKSWEDFGLTLKHKMKKITWKSLMHSITVEEEHKKAGYIVPVEFQPKAHIVTGGKQSQNSKNKQPSSFKPIKAKLKIAKKPKANRPCWNCGQMGHWAKLCPNKKAKAQSGGPQVNVVTGGTSSDGLQLEEQ
ncbi:unnamed protein product [Cuscuta epithymum]|uniref:CCHC-type domain-containing protein n=1 Tax=Cuscuta epithymum TaxID=186058 RepID=A0AAV0F0V3_9ASTE|nr:unnamed protein product [Cuscuta epithymum]